MVQIIIGITKCKIVNLQDSATLKKIAYEMSYKVEGAQFTNSNWDGTINLFDRRTFTFPVGLFQRAKDILDKKNIPYEVDDRRPKIKYNDKLNIDPNSGYKARDYQIDMVNKAWEVSKVSPGGIIRAATGAGKTLCIAMLTAKFGIKTVIYVIGIELLYQMKETIERAFPDIKVGVIGDGKCDIQDVTICTIWSAAAAFNQKFDSVDSDLTKDSSASLKSLDKTAVRDMVNQAQLIIVDECQYAASNTVQFLHKESKSAIHRFLFSGTPWREQGDDILIEAVGGPKFFDLDASTLIKQGWLVKPEIHFVTIPNKRNIGKTYQEIYSNFIVNNDYRNDKIIEIAERLVNDGKKVLILVSKVSHGKELFKMASNMNVTTLDGKNSTKDRLSAIQAAKDGEIDLLIASKIFDQGVDIPQLDALILAGSGKSTGRALQRIGRVIRKHEGKTRAVIIDFYDDAKYLRDHSLKRLEIYRTESEFLISPPKKK